MGRRRPGESVGALAFVTDVSADALEAAIAEFLAREAAGNAPLKRWVNSTMAGFERKFAAIADPHERAQARTAALMFIRSSLEEWSRKPPLGE